LRLLLLLAYPAAAVAADAYCLLLLLLLFQLLWKGSYACPSQYLHTFLVHVHCLDLPPVQNLYCNLVACKNVFSHLDLQKKWSS